MPIILAAADVETLPKAQALPLPEVHTEVLEIGDIPFTTAHQKPTREEALEYYRKVSEHYHLDIRQYEWVKTVMGEDGNFSITATDRVGRPHDYKTRKVIVSTGYYDLANQLCIPGEDMPKASHYS